MAVSDGGVVGGPVSDRTAAEVKATQRKAKDMAATSSTGQATQTSRLDVLIAGAGYVGLAAAVSIRAARPNLKVAVVDAAPAGVWEQIGRAHV